MKSFACASSVFLWALLFSSRSFSPSLSSAITHPLSVFRQLSISSTAMDKMSLHHSTRATHALRHQESFRSAVHSIHDAVNRAMVSDKKYTKVAVLSLRWDNGDLTCDGFLERDLLHTFRDIFHYNIESFLIPSIATRKAATAVREKIQDFVDKYDSETSLLIFVYMGHSATETAQTLKI